MTKEPTMPNELLPCPNPWCRDNTPKLNQRGGHLYYVMCTGCGIKCEYEHTEAEAITAWNTRPTLSHAGGDLVDAGEVKAMVGRLRTQAQRLREHLDSGSLKRRRLFRLDQANYTARYNVSSASDLLDEAATLLERLSASGVGHGPPAALVKLGYQQQIDKARKQALEEAAKVADDFPSLMTGPAIAHRIRALSTQQEDPK